MESAILGMASLGAVLGEIDLDFEGFVFGSEFAALVAAVFSAFFAGFANALIGNLFNNGP